MKTTRTPMTTRIVSFLAALLLAGTAFAATPDGRAFATPEDAVKALTAALKANDDKALVEIFGERNKDLVVTSDKAAATETRQKAVKLIEEYLDLRKDGDSSITLVMGANAWPMPIPLVKDGGGWRFDTDKGADEIINRRVGANELSAIEIMRAFPGAQRQYAAKPRDGSSARPARRTGCTGIRIPPRAKRRARSARWSPTARPASGATRTTATTSRSSPGRARRRRAGSTAT
jgi:Protein of unknown function (DUF2950)